MQNIDENIPESERIEVIDNYIDRLLVSGYKVDQIREIIESGLKGYIRKLKRAKKSENPLHRPAASTLQSRIKKLTEKSSWYKKKPNTLNSSNNPPSNSNSNKPPNQNTSPKVISVMFVQKTPDSLLANRLREADRKLLEISGYRLRIVERAGLKLRSLLHKSDPWDGQKCSDKRCLICTNSYNKKFGCSKRNIAYKSVCLTCKDEAVKAKEEKNDTGDTFEKENDEEIPYIGESHVSGRERSIQHARDYSNKKDDSHQYKHYTEAHADLEMKDVKFGMTILQFLQPPAL